MGNMQEMLESADGKKEARASNQRQLQAAFLMITFAIAMGKFDASPKCDPVTL